MAGKLSPNIFPALFIAAVIVSFALYPISRAHAQQLTPEQIAALKASMAAKNTAPAPPPAVPTPAPASSPKTPPKGVDTNPLLDTYKAHSTNPMLPGPQQLQDYRSQGDVNALRENSTPVSVLPLFGYSYFTPARQLIDARRAYLQSVMVQLGITGKTGAGVSVTKPLSSSSPPVQASESSSEAMHLTDAQKVDLLTRQRDNKLTAEEKVKYKDFLNPTSVSGGPDLGVQNNNSSSASAVTSGSGGVNTAGPMVPDISAFNAVSDPLQQFFSNITASAPSTYQLSGGDVLTLRYWSPTMEMKEEKLVVDQTGGISLPAVGRVIVRGQTLQDAENALRARMKGMFKDVQLSLSLQELRTMQVTVSGESYYPGTYTVPAVATAFNMIYATGGPTDNGTMRNIEIRRRGMLAGSIDFYKFLLTGDQGADIQLQPGDVIYFPPRHERVALRGEVRRPGIYELLSRETLKDAIQYSGGINPSGVEQRVQISTVQPGVSRMLKDVNLQNLNTAEQVPMYDGDVVDVFSVRSMLVNKVSISGAVDLPGEYAISDNMRVSDLIQQARGLMSDAFPTLAHLYRYNSDNTMTLIPVNLTKALNGDEAANIPLQRWDRLVVYSRDQVAWIGRREVTVRGAVKNPGIYYRSENMRVKDLLMMAGGTTPNAYVNRAVLLHQLPDGTFAYDYIDLTRALKNDPADDLLLKENDVLAVYTQDEAKFTPEHNIQIEGEVVTPGSYPRGENMRLSDAIRLAGGLTPRAGNVIDVAHARSPQTQTPVQVTWSSSEAKPSPDPLLEDGDVITIQGVGDYREKPAIVFVKGAVKRPGPVILNGTDVRLSDVIKDAGGLNKQAYAPGIEFVRDPNMLETEQQKQIGTIVNSLNDIINQSDYQRALALSDVERIKMIGGAMKSSLPLEIPGITPTTGTADSAASSLSSISSMPKRDLVSAPRSLTPSDLTPYGNVAVNLPMALKTPGGKEDILMKDGDTVTIPETPTTVQVIGAVVHPQAVVFIQGAKADYYIVNTGGYAPDAAKDRIEVIRLGGGLIPLKNVKRIEPGDVILVPTKVLSAKISSQSSLIDNIFRNITSTALIVLVAKKLLGL
jgi:protein involved in polysaccharide export with SLBB domain